MSRAINLVVIHCSASANGDGLFRGKSGEPGFKTPLDIIDGWHAERGFLRSAPIASVVNPRHRHIGYHYVISCSGALFTGRDPQEVGAHVAGYNAESIGICMTGTDRYTQAQWDKLAALMGWIEGKSSFGVALQSPTRISGRLKGGVCGHRDLSPDKDGDGVVEPFEWLKTCPGFDVAAWLQRGMKPTPDMICEELPCRN